MPGIAGGSAHFTLSWAAAWIAAYSVGATTPRKFAVADDLRARDVLDRALVDRERSSAPCRRRRRPGRAAARRGRAASPAPGCCGRRCSCPVTLSGMSTRGGLVPTILYWLTGFVPGEPATRLSRRRRVAGGREARDRRVEQLVADQRAVGDGLAAARDDAACDGQARDRRRRGSSTASSSSAASRRGSRGAGLLAARLDALAADAAPWFGVTFVSCVIIFIWLKLMSSSSAAIISSAVGVPWPISTLPSFSVAVLSAWIDRATSRPRSGRTGPSRRTDRSAAFAAFAPSPAPSDGEADDQRAAALDERLARELLVEHLGHGYFPPFAITAAAFWIAVRIRG